jgi:signal transduction histidine kinase
VPFAVDSSTYGDEEKIQKALNKVILNGLKFTPDGGMVTISAASELKHSNETERLAGFIDIQIQDMGVGIDPNNFETIFQ